MKSIYYAPDFTKRFCIVVSKSSVSILLWLLNELLLFGYTICFWIQCVNWLSKYVHFYGVKFYSFKIFLFYFIWKAKITQTEWEREIIHLLVHFPNSVNDWGWTNPKPRARIFIWVSHMGVGPKHLDPIFVKFLKLIYNTNWTLLDDFILISLLGHTAFSLPSLLTTSRVVLASHMGAGSSLNSSALNSAPCLSTRKVFWPLHHMGGHEEVWDS